MSVFRDETDSFSLLAKLVAMAFSKKAIVLLTFLVMLILTIFTSREKRKTGVVTYTLGDEEFEEGSNEASLLHVEQVLRKADPDGNLTVVISSKIINGPTWINRFLRRFMWISHIM